MKPFLLGALLGFILIADVVQVGRDHTPPYTLPSVINEELERLRYAIRTTSGRSVWCHPWRADDIVTLDGYGRTVAINGVRCEE